MEKVLGKKSAIAIFVLPGLILFTVIMIMPIFSSLSYSLTKWDGLNDKVFVGLSNFKAMPRRKLRSLLDHRKKYRIYWRDSRLSFRFPWGLILALVLADGVKGEGFYRTVYFTPVVVSATVGRAAFP